MTNFTSSDYEYVGGLAFWKFKHVPLRKYLLTFLLQWFWNIPCSTLFCFDQGLTSIILVSRDHYFFFSVFLTFLTKYSRLKTLFRFIFFSEHEWIYLIKFILIFLHKLPNFYRHILVWSSVMKKAKIFPLQFLLKIFCCIVFANFKHIFMFYIYSFYCNCCPNYFYIFRDNCYQFACLDDP